MRGRNTSVENKKPARHRGRPRKTQKQALRDLFQSYALMSDEDLEKTVPGWLQNKNGPNETHQKSIDEVKELRRQLMLGAVGRGLTFDDVALLNEYAIDELDEGERERILAPVLEKLRMLEQKRLSGSRQGATLRAASSRKKWSEIFSSARQLGLDLGGAPYPLAKKIRVMWSLIDPNSPRPTIRGIADALIKHRLASPKKINRRTLDRKNN